MHTPILILHTPGNGYVAGDSRGTTAEGATPQQALAKLLEEADRRQAERLKAMTITAPEGDHPLLRWAGTWDPNDPVIQEWKKAVEDYRREIDNDPTR